MNLTAVVSQSNCTTVSITVSWEPPVNTPTGYVIYYEQQRQVLIKNVPQGDISNHTLKYLQRGVTYNISIVALSDHLPSLLVGPVTVYQGRGLKVSCYMPIIQTLLGPLLITETQAEPNRYPNTLFSVVCTVIAQYDGQPLNTTITWTRITTSPMTVTTESVLAVQEFTEEEASILSSSHSGSGSGFTYGFFNYSSGLCNMSSKWGYQSVFKTTENITNNTVIYRCSAATLGNTSFSDTTVVVKSGICLTNLILAMFYLCSASDPSETLISSATSIKTSVTTLSSYINMSTKGVTMSFVEATETSEHTSVYISNKAVPTMLPISSNNSTTLKSSTVLSNEPVQIASSLNNVTILSSITVTTAESLPPDTG